MNCQFPRKMKAMKMPLKWHVCGLETTHVMFRYCSACMQMLKKGGVDELWAWGNILGDVAQHIAYGLKMSHGWDEVETMRKLSEHFNVAMKARAPR